MVYVYVSIDKGSFNHIRSYGEIDTGQDHSDGVYIGHCIVLPALHKHRGRRVVAESWLGVGSENGSPNIQ